MISISSVINSRELENPNTQTANWNQSQQGQIYQSRQFRKTVSCNLEKRAKILPELCGFASETLAVTKDCSPGICYKKQKEKIV